MRKWISVGLLVGASSLATADPLVHSPFAGFHAGANISYILASTTNTYDTDITITQDAAAYALASNYSQKSLAATMGGGGSLGYNLQLGSKFILGLETRVLMPQSYL